jgi:hypothetical protein
MNPGPVSPGNGAPGERMRRYAPPQGMGRDLGPNMQITAIYVLFENRENCFDMIMGMEFRVLEF